MQVQYMLKFEKLSETLTVTWLATSHDGYFLPECLAPFIRQAFTFVFEILL